MGERFSRSWRMLAYSATILRQDRELIVFPLLSSLAAILVFASFVPLLILNGAVAEVHEQLNLPVVALIYFAEYFVMFFFNAALVGAALIRMDGGDPTVGDGLRIAWSRIGVIFGYTLIAATVGVLLRAAGERSGLLGRLLVGLLGVAWTAASFLVVPILVSRNTGPLDAVRESAALLKKSWGENVISNAGIGLAFMLFYVVAFVVLGLLIGLASMSGNMALLIGSAVAGMLALIVLGLLQAALQGIFSAVLYRYATDGTETGAFRADELHRAFAPRLR